MCPLKIHEMSDLHFEHMSKEGGEQFFKSHADFLAQHPAKLLVLAGDICQVGRHQSFFRARLAQLCQPYERVLYVPGNHEYYSSSFNEVDRFMESLDSDPNLSNLVRLDQGPYTWGGVRFIGGTMWFPDTGEDYWTKRMMADFGAIVGFEPEVYRRHSHFRLNVAARLERGDVVVTHHTPLPESIDAQYKDSAINPFFMADMSQNLYEGTLPQLWIHGHTHTPFNYVKQVGDEFMRVYCNPLGYPNEGENLHFWDQVELDIPDPSAVP